MLQRFPFAPVLLPTAIALLALPCASAARSHRAASRSAAVAHTISSHGGSRRMTARSARYERVERPVPVHHDAPPPMETERATAIQTALIHAGYLSGEPTGVWDADSVAAMQKMQDANGWQTKYTPDSRALVKLGLGPTPIPVTPQPAVVADATPTAEQK